MAAQLSTSPFEVVDALPHLMDGSYNFLVLNKPSSSRATITEAGRTEKVVLLEVGFQQEPNHFCLRFILCPAHCELETHRDGGSMAVAVPDTVSTHDYDSSTRCP